MNISRLGKYLTANVQGSATRRKQAVGEDDLNLSSRDIDQRSQKPLPDWEKIDSVAALPTICKIYTAAKAEFELSPSLRNVLIALGDHRGQAWILMDPDAFFQHSMHPDSLR